MKAGPFFFQRQKAYVGSNDCCSSYKPKANLRFKSVFTPNPKLWWRHKAFHSFSIRWPVLQLQHSLMQPDSDFPDAGSWAQLNVFVDAFRVTLRPLIMCLGDVTPTPHGELLDLTSHYRACYVNYVRHPRHNHCTTQWGQDAGPPVFVSSLIDHISKPQNWDILMILKPLRVSR